MAGLSAQEDQEAQVALLFNIVRGIESIDFYSIRSTN
jgi:hypothetical protein